MDRAPLIVLREGVLAGLGLSRALAAAYGPSVSIRGERVDPVRTRQTGAYAFAASRVRRLRTTRVYVTLGRAETRAAAVREVSGVR